MTVAAVESAPVVQESVGAQATTGSDPAAPQAEIETMVSELGLDPAQFAGVTDLAAARVKAQTIIDMNMQQGRTVLQQIQQPPEPQGYHGAPVALTPAANNGAVVDTAQFSAKPLDLKGIDENDAFVPVLKDLHQQVTAAQQVAHQATAKLAEIEKRTAHQSRVAREAEIDRVFDSLKDPLFGSGRNRTPAQEATRREVRTSADYAWAAAVQSGLPEPSIEARIKQASFYYKSQRPGATTAPAQTVAGSAGMNVSSPQAQGGVPKMGIHEKWSEHPEMKRILGI
jgi:hypothetical protein